MLICRNAEGIKDQTKVGNPCIRWFLINIGFRTLIKH